VAHLQEIFSTLRECQTGHGRGQQGSACVEARQIHHYVPPKRVCPEGDFVGRREESHCALQPKGSTRLSRHPVESISRTSATPDTWVFLTPQILHHGVEKGMIV